MFPPGLGRLSKGSCRDVAVGLTRHGGPGQARLAPEHQGAATHEFSLPVDFLVRGRDSGVLFPFLQVQCIFCFSQRPTVVRLQNRRRARNGTNCNQSILGMPLGFRPRLAGTLMQSISPRTPSFDVPLAFLPIIYVLRALPCQVSLAAKNLTALHLKRTHEPVKRESPIRVDLGDANRCAAPRTRQMMALGTRSSVLVIIKECTPPSIPGWAPRARTTSHDGREELTIWECA